MALIKTNVEGLYRDENSGALLNRDTEALRAYKKRKEHAHRMMRMEARQEDLEHDIEEIKMMLSEVIKRFDKKS